MVASGMALAGTLVAVGGFASGSLANALAGLAIAGFAAGWAVATAGR